MSDKEVKVRISTDPSAGIEGINKFKSSMSGLESHTGSFVSKIKSHWLGMSAAVYAAYNTVNKAWDLAEYAAGYIEQMQQLDALALKYDTTSAAITGRMQEIGDGMISMSTSSQVALSALGKNLDPEKLYGLSRAAVVLKDTMNMNANEALKTLSESLEANKQKAIKTAVGVIDLKDRYGDLADKMTEAEKQAAFYNIIMEKTEEIQRRTGNSTKSVADQMETFKTTVENLKIELGMGLIRVGAGVIGVFQGISTASLLVSAGIWKIIQGYDKLQAFVSTGDWKKYYESQSKIAGENAAADWNAAQKYAEKANSNFALMTASTNDLIKAQGKAKASSGLNIPSLGHSDDAAKTIIAQAKLAYEQLKALDKDYFAMQEMLLQENEQIKIIFGTSEFQARKETYEKEIVLAQEYYDRTMKEMELAAKARSKDERTRISDATFIASKEVEIAAEKARRIAKIESELRILMAQKGEGLTSAQGWDVGLKLWENQIQNAFEYGRDLAKTTATSMSSSFSNLFFDAVKGDMKDFKTYWESFADAILRKMTDNVAEMVTQWIMGLSKMQSSTNSSGFGGILGSIVSGIGSLFGFGESAASLTYASAASSGGFFLESAGGLITPAFHGGGIVGSESTFTRPVPAFAFSVAPRFHKGFAPDEYPAILQRGEGVFTPRQMAALGKGSGDNGGGQTNITIVALDSRSFEDYAKRNAPIIREVVTQGLRDNKTRDEYRKLLRV
jgi:hypothetical protein